MLKPVGSNGYLKQFLEDLKSQRPDLDARLVTAILLCLVAGERHLLIRTEENDVAKVAAVAADILVSLFGLPTQRVQVHKKERPDAFLRSLFLVPPASPHHSRYTTYRPSTSLQHLSPPPKSKYRAPSADSSSSDDPPDSLSGAPAIKSHRRTVQSSATARASILAIRPESGYGYPLEIFQQSSHEPPPSSTGSYLISNDTANRGSPDPHNPVHDLSQYPVAPTTVQSSTPKLPHALVLTRLERADFATWATLSQVLQKRCLSLPADLNGTQDQSKGSGADNEEEWRFPSGFCTLYVCGLGNGTDRPPLPSFLLDAFAFNTTILLETPRSTLSSARLRPTRPLLSSLDLEELRHAAAVQTHISTHLDTYIMNLFLAVRHHSHLDGSLLSVQCTHDMEDFVRSACVLFGSSIPFHNLPLAISQTQMSYLPSSLLQEEDQILFPCTEKDVARIFAGVLAHRLAVQQPLDGPLRSFILSSVDYTDSVPPDDLQDRTAANSKPAVLTVHGILAGILRTV